MVSGVGGAYQGKKKCWIAWIGQAALLLAAIVRVIPFLKGSVFDEGNISSIYDPLPRILTLPLVSVTGAPYREVNSTVATAPKLKVEDKDRVNNSRRIKTVKLNIIKLKASLNKFSRGKSWFLKVECQTLKLK